MQGVVLDKNQLDQYFEKMASDHLLKNQSERQTYPIPRLNENYQVIKMVYKLLNNHIKLGIPIHPAGEWILDNFYIVEEIVKNISKDMTLKKYLNFVSVANDHYLGFARVYVLASEMIAFTDGMIDSKKLEEMLKSYQNKKKLSMEEIWNIGIFLQIALIEKIRQICEKIYDSQKQKSKVEEILSSTIDKNSRSTFKDNFFLVKPYFNLSKKSQIKYTFVEYMSYRLKKYGKKALPYLKILNNEMNKAGTSVEEIIRKEHFDVALKKVSMGNAISSLKEISRIHFLEIFEKLNGVEDILKADPSGEYEKMDAASKVCYRNEIEEIAKKTKLSEIYIANKCLELSKKEKVAPKNHIGYYLISDGKKELWNDLATKRKVFLTSEQRANWYFRFLILMTLLITGLLTFLFYCQLTNLEQILSFSRLESVLSNTIACSLLFFMLLWPIENTFVKIIQYFCSKLVKPKLIPKIDLQEGVPKEYTTMVVIPTILKSGEKVKELFEKLEVYYIGNQSENLYFTLLGDCSSSSKETEEFDNEVIQTGIQEAEKLNQKYSDAIFPKFHFIYRKRIWNAGEKCYLGWERKRGLLDQFNEYLLGKLENPFRVNTIEKEKKSLPKIKYIITLDSDTDLTLQSGIELIGAMAHSLNQPVLNQTEDLVISGHGIIAPRVGIGLKDAKVSYFTMLYAGQGGTDSYTNAISDFYQDNFGEGIYAGKGIYDLAVFSKILNGEIQENTVLSHDLIEGSYLRAGYASDIMLMDGYPSHYLASRKRLYRWMRGDWQVTLWLKNRIKVKNGSSKRNPLGLLSKLKIMSNIIRSKQEEKILILGIFFFILQLTIQFPITGWLILLLGFLGIPTILDIFNMIISKKENSIRTKSFAPNIPNLLSSICRVLIGIATLPDRAYLSLKAQWITFHRMHYSKQHLLEWETAEEAEKTTIQTISNYMKTMIVNLILGGIGLFFSLALMKQQKDFFLLFISIIWLCAPLLMYYISKKIEKTDALKMIEEKQKIFLNDLGYRTWLYFKDNLNQQHHFLPPDNFQEDRKPQYVLRTSSTNIGLALLSVVSSYDMRYETLEKTINLLFQMMNTIVNLPKWNGHLYNWYDIMTLQPLNPKFISSVDSGNFVGYLYVLLPFLEEAKEKIKKECEREKKLEKIERKATQEKNLGDESTLEKINTMTVMIRDIISATDFSKLYDSKNRLFSVGFNVEENQLVDSYYDLLASEARQTSFVAIAKKDISAKHWNSLSRTLTTLNHYKGLVSWAGTAFEYLMPTINIPNDLGSILDESCKFMIMSQIEYSKKLGTPWGFSEAAFYLKDLYNHYQYKAFGIPWLGLKRGLADEIVVSSYGTALALLDAPIEATKNLIRLKENGMYGKYGLYEAMDFTPERVREKFEVVKTYMAHHQGLILLSLNNLFHQKILQKRFMKNPEMQAIHILLEEKMPENMILTKEEKEKVEKIKYIDYEDYQQRSYSKIQPELNISNVIANENYTIVMDQYGNGYSKYHDIQVNRFKVTDDVAQGISFYLKDVKNKRIWTNTYSNDLAEPDQYEINFFPDCSKIVRMDGAMKTVTKVITATDDPVEIRRLELSNTSMAEQMLETTAYIEPILSEQMQDIAHKAFNNLFLTYEYLSDLDTILIKRRSRSSNEKDVYMAVKFFIDGEENHDTEFEIDKEKFWGRDNLGLPIEVEHSIPFSRRIENVTDPIVALKKIVRVQPEETKYANLILSIGDSKQKVINAIQKFSTSDEIGRTFELSKARIEAETRYLGLKGKEIETYQRLLSYLIFPHKFGSKVIEKDKVYQLKDLWKYGISGDYPILLVKIKNVNDIDVVQEAINAYEYYRTKNIIIDLVILNEEKENYESYVKEAVQLAILNKNLGYLMNVKGGIYSLNNIHNEKDKELIEAKANVVVNAEEINLKEQINELEQSILENVNPIGYDVKNEYTIYEERKADKIPYFNEQELEYFNEYGGFLSHGEEYMIRIHKNQKLPSVWSHIMANEHFGTLVTESLGGYTWSENSRLNRMTAWNNDRVTDVPSEIIYFKDMETGKKWSMGLNPMPDENDYYAVFGFGYAKFIHHSDQLEQELTTFVPKEDSVKINLLRLVNHQPMAREIKLVYYIKPVLGEDELKTNGNLTLEFQKKLNTLLLRNTEKNFDKIFVTSSEKIHSYTGNKTSFFYRSTLTNPAGLDQLELNRDNCYGKDGIIAVEMRVRIEAMAEKEIVITFGTDGGEEKHKIQDLAYQYANITTGKEKLIEIQKYWKDFLSRIQVETPSESTNILLNGWLIYQTMQSRLIARTGFYQSGGAYGFRDQLQDTLAIKYFDPERMRSQILLHSQHQFEEGDVEHWWHNLTERGIRTRFSDDLLWLPYVTANYIEYMGDDSILEETAQYLRGSLLKENEIEKYDLYLPSKKQETIYEHCIKAIDRTMNIGEHGLPLIGSGDWNDGFSNVGVKGKGESVWLGFFLYTVLKHFIPICQRKEDTFRVEQYRNFMEKLKRNLNTNGWDGRWFKRAFMDDGEILGSLQNEECRIDSISQSWSVISDAGENDKKFIAMESLENHLVDKTNGMIKLIDPPFDKSKINPGYIKAYIPGIRENGGQYTHAAIWTIIAYATLGFNEKAFEYFKMINPIEHSKTKELANKYTVEPYVIAADVYAAENLTGRGGWTWYTGSSSWMYLAGLESILGIHIEGKELRIEPHVPSEWKEYRVKIQHGNSLYLIKVQKALNGQKMIKINDVEIKGRIIQLDDRGGVFKIEAFIL